ncbi:type I restriction endonuclease subunit S [Bifidobacterium samirii]|uniref:Type I restriction endonuclease subunit S n=1 Tax=Bifidobacterium samirii TaxID=2306974 RepID=A0A430FTU7_9BIFI|nr:type I restriction endonuclease subunit S [Bifidobacterium samirii]
MVSYYDSSLWYKEVSAIAAEGARNHGLLNVTPSDFFETRICLPQSESEQKRIGEFFKTLDDLIAAHERKLELLRLKKRYYLQQIFSRKLRFRGFTEPWQQRKLGDLYEKSSEKNDGSYGIDAIISVANMRFKADASIRDESYLKTYNIMRLGDIAFEGHSSKDYSHGRFVENDIGDGIVSHVFEVLRPTEDRDLVFWKYYINDELVMRNILIRSTKATTMMHTIVINDFLREKLDVPSDPGEQQIIGKFLVCLDALIDSYQTKKTHLDRLKTSYLQKLFV